MRKGFIDAYNLLGLKPSLLSMKREGFFMLIGLILLPELSGGRERMAESPGHVREINIRGFRLLS